MKVSKRVLSTLAVAAASALIAMLLPAGAANAATTPAAGIQIRMAHSNKCLNVSGASTAINAKIVQYGCAAATVTNDKFKIVPRGDDNYWIQGVGSGKCLNVAGNSQANGGLIIQYTCASNLNTLWRVDEVVGQPTVRFFSASSGKCLNLPNAQTADNIQLIQYTCTAAGAANEKFYMPPTTSGTATHRAFTSKQPISVIQGGANGPAGDRPIYYSYVGADHRVNLLTDLNPDATNPDDENFNLYVTDQTDYGYFGRTEAALLSDGRVQVAFHDAADGDTKVSDEQGSGTGDYPFYSDLGGAFAGQPTTGTLVPNSTLATYAIVNGALWYAPQQANNPQTPYGAWRSLGGTGLTGTPVISASGTGARITALTTSGTLQTATLANSTLSTWTNLGGTGLSGIPSVVVGPGNITSIFVRGADGTVAFKKQNTDGTFATDWTSLPGLTITGSPSAVLDKTPGDIAVFARGTDNQIHLAYETAQGSGEYFDWTAVSDPQVDPSAASDPTAFAYDLPSGASFGVAYQTADDVDLPYVFTFPPTAPTAPAAKAAKSAQAGTHAVPQAERHELEKPKADAAKAN